MRPALRVLATVKPIGRTLEPGAPTGLCGLSTHPAPRPTLLYLYSKTLDKLKRIPECSVYRQSTEALTRHRLAIIERIEPAGLAAWQERVEKEIATIPEASQRLGVAVRHTVGGKAFITVHEVPEPDEREQEWDGEPVDDPELEGTRTYAERKGQKKAFSNSGSEHLEKAQAFSIEREPSLTTEQVSAAEKDIGAGLIEEVIQAANDELKLVDTMLEHKVWEELCEKPAEGQWSYFERKH